MTDIIELSKKFICEIDKKYKIQFSYLFGSQATKNATEASDVDLAVYFGCNYEPLEELFIRGEIIEEGKAFFKKEIDLVSIKGATLLLQYEIIRSGIVIKDDEITRGDFESLTLREYFDFKYYSDIYDNELVENIKKDRYFGEWNYG